MVKNVMTSFIDPQRNVRPEVKISGNSCESSPCTIELKNTTSNISKLISVIDSSYDK